MVPSVIVLGQGPYKFSPTIQGSNLTTDQLLGQLNTITTAVPFLLISPESRAGGMGDAGCASTPDAGSIHWNPSKMAFLEKKMGFGVSYTPWLRALVPDINLAYLTGYYKASKNGTIGGSLRYFSLGDITFTDIVGNVTGQFRPNEFALDVAYGRKLGDNFSAGGAVRYIYSNLTNGVAVQGSTSHAGMSVAADISCYYRKKDVEIGGKKSIVWADRKRRVGSCRQRQPSPGFSRSENPCHSPFAISSFHPATTISGGMERQRAGIPCWICPK